MITQQTVTTQYFGHLLLQVEVEVGFILQALELLVVPVVEVLPHLD
jgi:hypothetical protein